MQNSNGLCPHYADTVQVIENNDVRKYFLRLQEVLIGVRIALRKMAQGQADSPQLDARVRDSLINLELLSQAAIKIGLEKDPRLAAVLNIRREDQLAKAYLEENDGAGNTFKATSKPVLIGTAVVGATTMIFSTIVALTHGLTTNLEKLSMLHAPFLLGLIAGGAVIY